MQRGFPEWLYCLCGTLTVATWCLTWQQDSGAEADRGICLSIALGICLYSLNMIY